MTEKQARAARQRYRALVSISYPTDPKVLERIRKGERVPMEERGMKRVPAGTVVSDIPTSSIPWLLAQGLIERAEAKRG